MTVSKKVEPGQKTVEYWGAVTDINETITNVGNDVTFGTVTIPSDMDSSIKAAYILLRYLWRCKTNVGAASYVSAMTVLVDNDLAGGTTNAAVVGKCYGPGVDAHVIWHQINGEIDIKAKATAGRTLTVTAAGVTGSGANAGYINQAQVGVRLIVK